MQNNDTFAQAFLKVQAAIRPAIKDRVNPGFKGSKYADLAAVWDAIKEPLQANGFSVIQAPNFDSADMWLETTLLHVSGEKIAGRYPIRPSKNDPQGYGSALTYARRYSISAMLGVIADDDDDGNAATGQSAPGREMTRTEQPRDEQPPSTDRRQAAANWCYEAKAHVLSLEARHELDAWTTKNSKSMDSAKPLAPNAHKALWDAIEQRRSTLQPMAAE